MTEKLFNINLETGDCVVQRSVQWECTSLEQVIADLQEAATGLTNPTLDISSEEDYDFRNYFLAVSGHRKMTQQEIDREVEERRKQKQFQEIYQESLRRAGLA